MSCTEQPHDQKVPDFYKRYDNFNSKGVLKSLINENELKFYEQHDDSPNEYETSYTPNVKAKKRLNSDYMSQAKTALTPNITTTNSHTKSSHHSMKRLLCDDDLATTSRLFKKSRSLVTLREMKEFNNLLDNDTIKKFFDNDKCFLVTDKYVLAMVFIYFKRARFELNEFTKINFFLALYLANDIEEDIDEYKYEILPWALGTNKWRGKFLKFLRKRDLLLKLIDYRAFVSRKCCEEVMMMMPDHPAWKRTRSADHGGATRSYLIRKTDMENGCENYIENELLLPRGPDCSPRKCPLCIINNKKVQLNEYDSDSGSSEE